MHRFDGTKPKDSLHCESALDEIRGAARTGANLLHPMKKALKRNATLGEVSDALRDVFGEYRP